MNNDNIIGTIGIATKTIELNDEIVIPEGARVQIIECDYMRGYTLLDLNTGIIISEAGFFCVSEEKEGEVPFTKGMVGIASRTIKKSFMSKILAGSAVQIVDVDDSGYTLLDLNKGTIIEGTGFKSFIPKEFAKANDTNIARGSR